MWLGPWACEGCGFLTSGLGPQRLEKRACVNDAGPLMPLTLAQASAGKSTSPSAPIFAGASTVVGEVVSDPIHELFTGRDIGGGHQTALEHGTIQHDLAQAHERVTVKRRVVTVHHSNDTYIRDRTRRWPSPHLFVAETVKIKEQVVSGVSSPDHHISARRSREQRRPMQRAGIVGLCHRALVELFSGR